MRWSVDGDTWEENLVHVHLGLPCCHCAVVFSVSREKYRFCEMKIENVEVVNMHFDFCRKNRRCQKEATENCCSEGIICHSF